MMSGSLQQSHQHKPAPQLRGALCRTAGPSGVPFLDTAPASNDPGRQVLCHKPITVPSVLPVFLIAPLGRMTDEETGV